MSKRENCLKSVLKGCFKMNIRKDNEAYLTYNA